MSMELIRPILGLVVSLAALAVAIYLHRSTNRIYKQFKKDMEELNKIGKDDPFTKIKDNKN